MHHASWVRARPGRSNEHGTRSVVVLTPTRFGLGRVGSSFACTASGDSGGGAAAQCAIAVGDSPGETVFVAVCSTTKFPPPEVSKLIDP